MKMLALTIGALLLAHAEPRDSEAAKPATTKLSLGAYTSAPNVVVLGSLSLGTSRIDAIWISMKDLRFREESPCDKAIQTYAQGPVTGELVGGAVSGLPESATTTVGRYCRFELTLRRSRAKSAGAPLDLRRASIQVLGQRADGVRFVIRTRLDIVLSLQAIDERGFAIVEGTNRLFLAVDAARWMAGIDFTVAEISHEGPNAVIRIDDKSNPDLLTVFQKNLPSGLSLFRDVDGDGVLSPSDRGAQGTIASGGP